LLGLWNPIEEFDSPLPVLRGLGVAEDALGRNGRRYAGRQLFGSAPGGGPVAGNLASSRVIASRL
jgi:hypothetical protein